MFTGKDRDKDKTSNMSENTTQSVGLFKWSLDALLRRKEESPSKKYKQPEEPRNINILFPESGEKNRTRSMSLDGFDPSFYQHYELLNEERPVSAFSGINRNDQNNNNVGESGKLMSPIKLQNDKGLCTDTFINKKHPLSNELDKDDTDTSLFAKLLNKEKFPIKNDVSNKDNITQTQTTIPIPGKFPKSKGQTIPILNPNKLKTFNEDSLDQIYNDLNINKSLLTQINEYVNQLIEENNRYKTDYSQVKLELLHEMKQCKNIMDRYTELTGKHKQLKTISNNIVQMNNQLTKLQREQRLELNSKDQRIRQLEIQLNKLNIKLDEKDIKISNLRNNLKSTQNQLMDDKIYYEREINNLQNSLKEMDEINILNQHPKYI